LNTSESADEVGLFRSLVPEERSHKQSAISFLGRIDQKNYHPFSHEGSTQKMYLFSGKGSTKKCHLVSEDASFEKMPSGFRGSNKQSAMMPLPTAF
jgi:hypothetical protein